MGYAPRDMSSAVTTIAPASELILRADTTFAVRNRWAMADIAGGARLWRLAFTLGWLDIRLRYRGSMLGPFLYSTLFKINVREYLPFLALSQVLWGFLAALVSEACTAFTEAEGVIRSVRMPFFVFSMRTLIRNAIALGHNVVVIVVVFAIFSVWPRWEALMAIPGLLVWCVDALALTLLLGGFCARFRDIQPIVNSVMQIAFFMTPVIWKPDQLGPDRIAELALNPFFDLLEIVRGPILDSPIAKTTWVGAIGYSVILCAISWAFFVRARGRVTFWV
jgi:lipopolysaccharide transport system permease protein